MSIHWIASKKSIILFLTIENEDYYKSHFLYNLYTMSQKNATDGFWLIISPPNLLQMWKVRSVLKSAGSQDFRTVLDFQFWPGRSWDIEARTHQGSFSFFTWIWKVSTDVTTLLDFLNLYLTSSITSSNIFYTNDPGHRYHLLSWNFMDLPYFSRPRPGK